MPHPRDTEEAGRRNQEQPAKGWADGYLARWPKFDLWPLRVHPLDDELFSSWLRRTILEYVALPHSFCRVVFGDVPIWNRDIDKHGTDDLTQRLAMPMAVPSSIAAATLLRWFEGRLYEHHNAFGITRWLLPLGMWHRIHRRGGLQYCPECLASDQTPFFRKRWRLSFVTACPQHHRLLLDRCPHCRQPVHYHRIHIKSDSLRRCYACGRDLAVEHRLPTRAPQALLQFQEALVDAAYTGVPRISGVVTGYSLLLFPGIATLLRLLLAPGKRPKRFAQEIFRSARLRPVVSPSGRSFDLLGVKERANLMQATAWLMENWPDRFVAAAHRSRVGISAFIGERDSQPFWFSATVLGRLDLRQYQVTDMEVKSAVQHLRLRGMIPTPSRIKRLMGCSDVVRKHPARRILFSRPNSTPQPSLH